MADDVQRWAGIEAAGPLGEALSARAAVLAGGARTRAAALVPREPGSLAHGLRAALAARIATHHGEAGIADEYRARAGAGDAAAADPAFDGGEDARLRAILRHVDLVTLSPKDTVAADIAALSEAGLAEADIVRLSELIAFLAHELRLVAGLRLLGGSQ